MPQLAASQQFWMGYTRSNLIVTLAVLIAYSAKLQFKLQAGELFQRTLLPAEISMKRRSRSITWNHL
jgi:hypothetical protein